MLFFLRKKFKHTKSHNKPNQTNKTKIREQKTTKATIFRAQNLLRKGKLFILNFLKKQLKLSYNLIYYTTAVAVGKIQGKSRFTVSEGELSNSTVAEDGMFVYNKNSVKRWDFSWFKNLKRVVPLPNQPNQFLKLRVIYIFVMQKSKHTYSSSFLLMS